MTSEQAVLKYHPRAEIRMRPMLGRTMYAVFISDTASARYESNILGSGWTRSKAWVDARKNLNVVALNNAKAAAKL